MVRLGLIGCGIVVRKFHLPAYKNLSHRFEITALYNRTKEKACEIVKEFDSEPTVYNTYEELLNSGIVDAIVLSVAPEVNPVMLEKIFERDIPVFCEKPIAINVEAGKKVLELVELKNGSLYLGENFRHIAVYRKAAEFVAEGQIGIPRIIVWNFWRHLKKENDYVKTAWRQKPQHVGGFMSDGGVHYMAAMRMIMGENVESVSAYGFQQYDYLGNIDTLAAHIKYASGAVGSYILSFAFIEGHDYYSVRGTEGYIIWDSEKIEVHHGDEVIVREIEERDNGFSTEFEDFYQFLHGKDSGKGSPEEALIDLATIEAMIRSLREERSVKVSELLEGRD